MPAIRPFQRGPCISIWRSQSVCVIEVYGFEKICFLYMSLYMSEPDGRSHRVLLAGR
jgi:hypothetical protein